MWYKEVFYRLAIFGWKDAIEILCMTGGLYFFSVWLQHDKQKKLVTHFYAMCSLVVIAHLTELPTLGSSLMSFFPAMIMLFILVHQKSLQSSFVALKNVQPSQTIQSNWLETLLRSCLIAMNNKQQVTCLIEGKDSLAELVTTPFTIKSKLQPDFLDMLLSSSTYDPQKMIWLSDNGILLGVNTTWQITDKAANNKDSQLDTWQQNSILFTAQTDTLAFRINPLSRTFDVTMEGKLIENMPTDQAIKLMHKHFRKQGLHKNKEGYDSYSQTEHNKQSST